MSKNSNNAALQGRYNSRPSWYVSYSSTVDSSSTSCRKIRPSRPDLSRILRGLGTSIYASMLQTGPRKNENHPKRVGSVQPCPLAACCCSNGSLTTDWCWCHPCRMYEIVYDVFPSVVLILQGFELPPPPPPSASASHQSFKLWRRPAASSTSKRMKTAW